MSLVVAAVLSAVLSAAPADEVVARAGDARITRGDVEARLAEGGARVAPAAALATLVDESLLAQDARRQGLEKTPEFARLVELAQARIAGRVFTERELTPKEIPEATLREIFRSSADSARLHVLRFATRETAAVVAGRLEKGADLFAEAQNSIDPAGARTVAHLLRAQLAPALAEAVFRAAPGAIVGPLEVAPGWTVARVEQVFVAGEDEFKAKRPGLVEYARAQITAEGRRHLLEQLRRTKGVVVDEKYLTSLGKQVEVAPEDLDRTVVTVAGRAITYRDLLPKFRWLMSGGGHMAGPAMKLQVVRQETDELLLGFAAFDRGFATAPEVVAARPGVEARVLAELASRKFRDGVPRPTEDELRAAHRASGSREPLEDVRPELAARLWATRQQEKLKAHVAGLRGRTQIVVDEAALGRVAPKQ